MSTTLTVNPIKASVGWNLAQTNTFGTDSLNTATFSYSPTMTNGTGAGKATLMYAATLTIAGGGNTALDLSGGAITDPFGTVVTFTKVKVIYVNLTTATTSSAIYLSGNFLTQTSGTAAPIISAAGTPELRIRNGGILMLGCTDGTGYTVTNSTEDTLTITNEDGSNSATVNIFLCGE